MVEGCEQCGDLGGEVTFVEVPEGTVFGESTDCYLLDDVPDRFFITLSDGDRVVATIEGQNRDELLNNVMRAIFTVLDGL